MTQAFNRFLDTNFVVKNLDGSNLELQKENSSYSHIKMIDLLYHVSDVEDVLQFFQRNGQVSQGLLYLERLFKTEQDKAFLESNLLGNKADRAKKAILKKM